MEVKVRRDAAGNWNIYRVLVERWRKNKKSRIYVDSPVCKPIRALLKLTYYASSRGRVKNFVLVVAVAFVIALNWSELSRQKRGYDKDIDFHCNESLQGSWAKASLVTMIETSYNSSFFVGLPAPSLRVQHIKKDTRTRTMCIRKHWKRLF
jgi:hypothetical protein